jgi:cell division protein ZapA
VAKVTLTVNQRNYDISCDNGEEVQLTRLGEYVNRRVDELVAKVGQVGDARLLVMACLLLADELSEVYTELDAVKDENIVGAKNTVAESELELMVARIESIAEKLEEI